MLVLRNVHLHIFPLRCSKTRTEEIFLRSSLDGLPKEEIANADGGEDASEVGEQASHDCVARVADTYAAEVDGKNVEGGVGAALENARQAPHK